MTLFTVRCLPRQQIIRVWSGWLLKSFVLLWHQTVRWHTRQSGAFWLRCSDFWLLHCALFTVHNSRPLSAVDCCSVGSPYMSGAHQTVWWIIAERFAEKPESGQFASALAWAPDSVRCAIGSTKACLCSKLCRVPQLIFLVGLCWTLCTWDKWQLGKLVSPRGLWWTSNTKIDYRKWLSPFPFYIPGPKDGEKTWRSR
jgi:hypothetical protein